MDEGRYGRIEEPKEMHREFGYQEERAQDTNGQVIVCSAVMN